MTVTNPRAVIVDEIKNAVQGASSVVCISFLGINVEQDTRLRKEMRENNVFYKVFKNTLIGRALEGTDFDKLSADLEGSTALAISKDDATSPARIAAKYAQEVKTFKLKGGVVEGVYYDASKMAEIASIPGRDVLISRLLASLNAPVANFARVLDQLAKRGGPAKSEPEATDTAADTEDTKAVKDTTPDKDAITTQDLTSGDDAKNADLVASGKAAKAADETTLKTDIAAAEKSAD